MTFRFDVLWKEWPAFAGGLLNTIWLCAVTAVVSLVLGMACALPLMSRYRPVRETARAIVDGARCIPFLLLTYLVYFALPSLGLRLDSWTAGIASLIGYNTAYMAEILRGAWSHLAPEHTEAAQAFGFTGAKLFRRIILPQVLIAAAPMMGNQLIQLIKDSAFLSIITIPELTFTANSVQSLYFVPFEAFLAATLLYWCLCTGVEALVARVERLASLRRDAYFKS